MKQLFKIVSILILAVMLVAACNIGHTEITNTEQQNLSTAFIDNQVKVSSDMGNKLLSDFKSCYVKYTPNQLKLKIASDPDWNLLGVNVQHGLLWIHIQQKTGVLSFAYALDGYRPLVMSWFPFTQPYAGLSPDQTLHELLQTIKKQFKQEPLISLNKHIVIPLSDDISAVISISQQGYYTVSVGFKKLLKLPDMKQS